MDETSKEQFKWKFYRLAVQLNAIITPLRACNPVPVPCARTVPAPRGSHHAGGGGRAWLEFYREVPCNKGMAS